MFSPDLPSLVTYNPWAVSSESTLDDLVRMLQEMGFHHWPVVDAEQRLVGVVSEVDIVRAVETRQAACLVSVGGEGGASDWSDCPVSEFMSRQVFTVDERDSSHAALGLLLEHQIHSLPVLSGERLVGMITSADFLRELSYGDAPLSREPVRDHMASGLEPVDVESSLDEASETFLCSGADYLPVVQGDFPLGVVSRRDVRKARCRVAARELLGSAAAPGPVTLSQIVYHAPMLFPGQRLAEAAGLLHEHQLQAAAVVNHANRLLGVLSEDELLRSAFARV